ncbi:MAG: hypothetical protein H0X25_18275 [Acidobacteriales bacterium]|nr:hypothetical protein [Terriglobales bacterium]MBA3915758.1 hypothetical protein [Terriglobales bacterium]
MLNLKKRLLLILAGSVVLLSTFTVQTAVASDSSPLPDCPKGQLCKP